jgi:hypothetical protein
MPGFDALGRLAIGQYHPVPPWIPVISPEEPRLIKVDYDMIPASVHFGHGINFNDVADWTNINSVGDAEAATCHTRMFRQSNFPVGTVREAGIVLIRFCIAGPGNARLASWYYDENNAPVWTDDYYETSTASPYNPQNLAGDITTKFNTALQAPNYIQFIPQVKGTGRLHMARLEVDWKV